MTTYGHARQFAASSTGPATTAALAVAPISAPRPVSTVERIMAKHGTNYVQAIRENRDPTAALGNIRHVLANQVLIPHGPPRELAVRALVAAVVSEAARTITPDRQAPLSRTAADLIRSQTTVLAHTVNTGRWPDLAALLLSTIDHVDAITLRPDIPMTSGGNRGRR